MARFFIERPVFAVVISIVIVLAGVAALAVLPIAQYPEISPPTVQVSCSYPGADARVVAETVAAPIEQQINGVENMLYMSSQCTNDGGYNLTITFKLGTDLDIAQVLVQNRVALAQPSLPDVVKNTGVTTKKKSPAILLVVNVSSDDDPKTGKPLYNQLYLSNYASIQLKDELARLDGVGDVSLLGQQDYSMRIWVDPEKLSSRNLTVGEVVNALKEQNVQVAAGRLGQPPVPTGLDFQYTLTSRGRLTEADHFADIVIKTGKDGALTRLKDVGRIELGAKNQDTQCTLDGRPSVGMAIYQLPGSNALATGDRIKARMAELRGRFPAGLRSAIVYDTTPFIEESVHEVFKALRDAVILVAVVVLLFLQDWKAVTLPMIDVPVSLIGTLAVLYLFGFTLNNLTLFGLVLAIGIVVDDAIVVLENVERWMAKGFDAKTATIKAMEEITGPIIAITLVLSSVFLPSALIPGITGQFYRQFALTISAAMIISAINAMTMTPSRAVMIFSGQKVGAHGHEGREALPWWGVAGLLGWLSAVVLESLLGPTLGMPAGGEHHELATESHAMATWLIWTIRAACFVPGAVIGALVARPVNQILSVVFRGFNKVFDGLTAAYGTLVAWSLRLAVFVLLVYGGLIGLTYFGFTHVPTGFIPSQDKGYLLINVQLPDSSSLERTVEVMKRVDEIALKTDGVAHTIAIPGQSFVLNAVSSNFGAMFIILKPFHDRHASELYSDAIAGRLRQTFNREIQEAQVAVFGAPAVDGLGNAGGFKLMVEDRGDLGNEVLQGQADNLAETGNQLPGRPLVGLFNSFRANTPQLYVDVDRVKCKSIGVPLSDVFSTLQTCLGGYYVNDFNLFGRTWQVIVQADSRFRLKADDIKKLDVRNAAGDMVPIGTLAEVRESSGPVMITRYNLYPAAVINGASAPGVSSGQVIKLMDGLADRELPKNMGYEWTELTYLQILGGNTAIFAFVGAVILVFLVLASQYESWSMPFSVVLVVPMCLLCAIAGIALARMDINIFVQVGFIVLIGLASKNAILIVEFARELRKTQHLSAFQAAVNSSTSRLRPIVMTSFAFILGVLPLVISTGAGAEMRRTLGTAVFSGMIGVTLFGIFLTPVFYYVVEWFGEIGQARRAGDAPPMPGKDDDPVRPETPTVTNV